jgi:hypothetical protein
LERAPLPRTRPPRDTLDVAATEFLSRRGFYRALDERDRSTRGMPSAGKIVMGAPGRIERHVSQGQDDTGRPYARLDRADRKWDVLVSHKGEQSRDIDGLRERR